MRRFILFPLLLLVTGCSQQPVETATAVFEPDSAKVSESPMDQPVSADAPTDAPGNPDAPIIVEPPEPITLIDEATEPATAEKNRTGEPQVIEVPYTDDSLETIKQNIENGSAVMIDVRNQDEWDESHLKIAKLIPISEFVDESTRAAAAEQVTKDKIVYIHCKMGGRAGMCAQVLGNMGFDARPMKMRYEEIVAGGFETE